MRQRSSYPKPFKAQVVQECLGPDVSIASMALRHGINANLVRKWIPIYRDRQACAVPAFVPLKLETVVPMPARQDFACIDISFGQRPVTVSWPISDPDSCARFIRSLSQWSASTPSGLLPSPWICAPVRTQHWPVSLPFSVRRSRTALIYLRIAAPTG